MDRRQKKTRNAIENAFCELLKEKEYSKITIQNILDQANIGRTTFYEHFKTKDELLSEICSNFFSHVFCPSPEPEKHHDFSDSSDFRHIVTHLFYHFSEDNEFVRGVLRSEGKTVFMNKLNDCLNKFVNDYILSMCSCKTFPRDLLVNHLIATLTELTLWWLNGGCIQTPEQISDWYFKLVEPVMEN